jgi:hypothetical protein
MLFPAPPRVRIGVEFKARLGARNEGAEPGQPRLFAASQASQDIVNDPVNIVCGGGLGAVRLPRQPAGEFALIHAAQSVAAEAPRGSISGRINERKLLQGLEIFM